MQAVVDYNYMFININVRHVGKLYDASVLQKSELFRKASSGDLHFQNWTENIFNIDIPLFLIGDPAHPCHG